MIAGLTDIDAILLAGDIARMTSPAETMEQRLARLAAHYRQRAMVAEELLRHADNAVAWETAMPDGREFQEQIEAVLGIGREPGKHARNA